MRLSIVRRGALVATCLSLATAIESKHPEFEADGRQVSSCKEYVFQKLYDFLRFTDSAKSLGDDYWAIFDLAHLPQTPGIADRTLMQFASGIAIEKPIPLSP